MADNTNNCLSCGQNHISYAPSPFGNPCSNVPGNCTPQNAECVTYNGPALTCLGGDPGDTEEQLWQKVDEKLCTIAGEDWSGFDYACLTEDITISTAQEFAQAISSQICNLKSDFDYFTGTQYQTDISGIQFDIQNLAAPNLTLCVGSGILSTDTYPQILTKIANKLCELSEQDLSSVDWGKCFTVLTDPTTTAEGFNLLLDQICQVKASVTNSVLPTFNNVGSCLPTPGTTDSLVATINKMKTRICQSVVYDKTSSVWSCISQPATFQAVMDAILTNLQDLMTKKSNYDTDYFTVTPNGCSGQTISLIDGISGTDRLVASDDLDDDPGTLADKLQAGDNITLSNTEVPGKIVIHADFDNDKVKTNGSDTAGFLQDKLVGSTGTGINVNTSTLLDNSKVKLEATLDFSIITNQWFDIVEADPDLYTRFCALICGCKPCNEPNNTPTEPVKRVRLRVVNNSPSQTFTNTYTLFQNSPVLGWLDNTITVSPSQTYESGWYDVTSATTSLGSTMKIVDANGTPKAQNLNIRVLQPGNTVIPGTSNYIGALGGGFTNTAFNLGSLKTDMTIEIQIS